MSDSLNPAKDSYNQMKNVYSRKLVVMICCWLALNCKFNKSIKNDFKAKKS